MAKKKPVTFAARLVAVRESKGLSRNELWKLSGVSRQTLSKLERDLAQPTWETVQALAKALGVSCEEFAVPD